MSVRHDSHLSCTFLCSEFTDNAGSFKTGAPDFDETHLRELFAFDFVVQPSGVAISFGEWQGAKPGTYQMLLSADTFTITIFPHSASGEGQITVYSAKKVVP